MPSDLWRTGYPPMSQARTPAMRIFSTVHGAYLTSASSNFATLSEDSTSPLLRRRLPLFTGPSTATRGFLRDADVRPRPFPNPGFTRFVTSAAPMESPYLETKWYQTTAEVKRLWCTKAVLQGLLAQAFCFSRSTAGCSLRSSFLRNGATDISPGSRDH